jgi:hypothetical protein
MPKAVAAPGFRSPGTKHLSKLRALRGRLRHEGATADNQNLFVVSRQVGKEGPNLVVLVVVVVLAMALVPLARGRLSALADLRIRWAGLLLLALAIQLLPALVPGEANAWRVGAHIASFPLGLAVVWANRKVPGIWVIGLGAALNVIAIVANGGVMPASVSALREAGLDPSPDVFVNSDVLGDPELLFLGDVFAVPESWPFSNVFSVGDVLVALGAVYAIHAVCGSRLVPARFRRVPTRAAAEGRDASPRV